MGCEVIFLFVTLSSTSFENTQLISTQHNSSVYRMVLYCLQRNHSHIRIVQFILYSSPKRRGLLMVEGMLTVRNAFGDTLTLFSEE